MGRRRTGQDQPIVRWIDETDYEWAAITANAAYDELTWDEKYLAKLFRQQHKIDGLVYDDGEPKGLLVFTNLGRIIVLVVSPRWRRQGIATAILEAFETRWDTSKVDRFYLQVRETMLAGQLFLRARGFKATAIVSPDDGCGDFFLFERSCVFERGV